MYATGSGDATITVQHCFDIDATAATQWFDHIDVSAGVTVSGASPIDGNYAYPVSNIRMNLTAVSGSPTAHFVVLQTGV